MAILPAPRAFYGRLHELPILVMKGHFRYMIARGLRDFVDDLVTQEGNDAVIIDLRELDAIDSTGMGLLARVGRSTLRHGRRSVIVCAVPDVMICLRSVAFDRLFALVEEWPFEEEPEVTEVPFQCKEVQSDALGRFVLEAHRELASFSEENREAFGGVISTLEAEFARKGGGSDAANGVRTAKPQIRGNDPIPQRSRAGGG